MPPVLDLGLPLCDMTPPSLESGAEPMPQLMSSQSSQASLSSHDSQRSFDQDLPSTSDDDEEFPTGKIAISTYLNSDGACRTTMKRVDKHSRKVSEGKPQTGHGLCTILGYMQAMTREHGGPETLSSKPPKVGF